MASDELLQPLSLRDDFYREGYYKAITVGGILIIAIAMLVSVSLYLYLSKPAPVFFKTGDDFRILPAVPVNKPYISQPDLIQWVSDVLPSILTFDFINYKTQLNSVIPFFTVNGWKNYSELLKQYIDYNTLVSQKLFVNAEPAGAPFIVNQGPLQPARTIWAWLIRMPINLRTGSVVTGRTDPLVIEALIVRVPTLNNLSGIAIEQLNITKGAGDQLS